LSFWSSRYGDRKASSGPGSTRWRGWS